MSQPQQPAQEQVGGFLGFIERAGNRIPDITMLFIAAFFRFFVKFWGAKVSMHSWRGHALNTVRVLFRCVC